ncbi:MAG: hypothetical protein O3B31_07860 [Chloroflexi bacterium]|nr:hypothetical protein [Chloroflexota bacterium]MDA1003250.1 hypothetical protein [Chloroflexota bacterium]
MIHRPQHVSQAVWPHLVEAGGGAVVNRSSLAAQRGFSPRMLEEWAGAAAGMANLVLFLASGEARFVTGESINADGGVAAKIEPRAVADAHPSTRFGATACTCSAGCPRRSAAHRRLV